MDQKKFWMVLGDMGSPTYRHSSRKGAVAEAERLAMLNPGKEFFVLESLAACKKADVMWYKTVGDGLYCEDVPF